MKEEEKRVCLVFSLFTILLSYFLTSVHSVHCLVYCLYWGRLEVPRFWQRHRGEIHAYRRAHATNCLKR